MTLTQALSTPPRIPKKAVARSAQVLASSSPFEALPPLFAPLLSSKLRERSAGNMPKLHVPALFEANETTEPARSGWEKAAENVRGLKNYWPIATDFYAKHDPSERVANSGFGREIIQTSQPFCFYISENSGSLFELYEDVFLSLKCKITSDKKQMVSNGNSSEPKPVYRINVPAITQHLHLPRLQGERGVLVVPDGHYRMQIEGTTMHVEINAPIERFLHSPPIRIEGHKNHQVYAFTYSYPGAEPVHMTLHAPAGQDCSVLRHTTYGQVQSTTVARPGAGVLSGVILSENKLYYPALPRPV